MCEVFKIRSVSAETEEGGVIMKYLDGVFVLAAQIMKIWYLEQVAAGTSFCVVLWRGGLFANVSSQSSMAVSGVVGSNLHEQSMFNPKEQKKSCFLPISCEDEGNVWVRMLLLHKVLMLL